MSATDLSAPAIDVAAPLIDVRDLHVSFRSRVGIAGAVMGRKARVAQAVDGVSLSLGSGEIVALAGESGCGKTTLARSLMGFVRPDRGSITFEGRPLAKGRGLQAYRRRVQMVYQDPSGALNPRQTVYESVAEGIRIHRIPGNEEALVARALGRAGLRPAKRFFLVYPHELSGGQRQRVVIAGALALDPSVIIADEPVSSLDASVRGEILGLLLQLRRESGITMLIVTHDLGLAWTVADRVAVMYLGRIVEIGPTRSVLTNPSHPYTKALLAALPESEAVGPRFLAGEPPDPTEIPPGCRFHPRCPVVADGRAEASGVLSACRGDDLGLDEVAPGHAAACHFERATRTSRDSASPD